MAAYDLIRCPTCSARPHDQQKVIKMGPTRQTRSHERPQPMGDGRSPHLHAQIPTHHNLAPPGLIGPAAGLSPHDDHTVALSAAGLHFHAVGPEPSFGSKIMRSCCQSSAPVLAPFCVRRHLGDQRDPLFSAKPSLTNSAQYLAAVARGCVVRIAALCAILSGPLNSFVSAANTCR